MTNLKPKGIILSTFLASIFLTNIAFAQQDARIITRPIGPGFSTEAPCRCSVSERRNDVFPLYIRECVQRFGLNPVAHIVKINNRIFSQRRDIFAYSNLPASTREEVTSNTCTQEIIDAANQAEAELTAQEEADLAQQADLAEQIAMEEAEQTTESAGDSSEENNQADTTEVLAENDSDVAPDSSTQTESSSGIEDTLCIAESPGIRGRLNNTGQPCYCSDNGNPNDIWGWDEENQIPCRFNNLSNSGSEQSQDCDYSYSELNDGWGWNPVLGVSCSPRS